MNEELEKLIASLDDYARAWSERTATLLRTALPTGIYPDMASIDTQAKITDWAHAAGMATAYLESANAARRLMQK